MYYLSVCNSSLLKSHYCYVLFFSFEKFFKYYEFFFYPISIFSWKNISLLTNIRNKWVIRKINFDLMKNGQIFPSKLCHFQCDHKFLLSREMGSSRRWKYVSKNLLNLNFHHSISFGIFQVGCKLISFGKNLKTAIAYEVFYLLKVFFFEDLLIWMPYIRYI